MTAVAPETAAPARPLPMPSPARLRARDLLALAALGPRTRPLRAALSALGVAIGIAAMVGVLGVSASSRAGLLARLDELGTDLLVVRAGETLRGEVAVLPDEAPAMVRRVGPVRGVAATGDVEASVRRTDRIPAVETGGIAVRAADPSLLATLDGRMRAGRFLDAATARYPVVVLGAVAAERLGVTRADGSVRVWLGERWFVVGGVLDRLPLAPELDRSALVGFPVAERLLRDEGSPATVYVRTRPEAVEAVRGVLAATANPAAPEEVEVSRPSDALAARAAADEAFTSLLLGLGGVALLVGGIGIANVMVVAVLERRTEIGVRRALGATRGQVRAQFLAESLLLSALGGVAGVGLGALVTAVYAAVNDRPFAVPPVALAGGLAGAALLGAVAGLYPAARAARLVPTAALRAE